MKVLNDCSANANGQFGMNSQPRPIVNDFSFASSIIARLINRWMGL